LKTANGASVNVNCSVVNFLTGLFLPVFVGSLAIGFVSICARLVGLWLSCVMLDSRELIIGAIAAFSYVEFILEFMVDIQGSVCLEGFVATCFGDANGLADTSPVVASIKVMQLSRLLMNGFFGFASFFLPNTILRELLGGTTVVL